MRRATRSSQNALGENSRIMRSGPPVAAGPPPAAGGEAAGGAAWATCGAWSKPPLEAAAEVSQAKPAAATRAVGTARKKGRTRIDEAPWETELVLPPKYGRMPANVPADLKFSSGVRPQRLHPLRKLCALGRRHMQAFLGAPPQHVVG